MISLDKDVSIVDVIQIKRIRKSTSVLYQHSQFNSHFCLTLTEDSKWSLEDVWSVRQEKEEGASATPSYAHVPLALVFPLEVLKHGDQVSCPETPAKTRHRASEASRCKRNLR